MSQTQQLTPWASLVNATSVLGEYPRPQLVRFEESGQVPWSSLNGIWQWQQHSPAAQPTFGQPLAETILVPFPPESNLSGIGAAAPTHQFYRRTFQACVIAASIDQ